MEKIHPIYKNDSKVGPIKDDKLQRSVATILGPTRRGNKRRLYLGNWTVSINRNDKTVREREPTSLPLYRLYALFRLHFVPERNKHHSRADFFNLKREPGEPAAETWKRILEIEKNCEFEEITAAEILASKFLSVIGKTTGDNDLKKKIKKGDM